MRKMMVFKMVEILFFVGFAPAVASAQMRSYPVPTFYDVFATGGGQQQQVTNVAADATEDHDDLVFLEVKRAFLDKDIVVLSSSEGAEAIVEITVSSNLVRSGYYVRREAVVYVEVKDAATHNIVVVGRGKNSNLRKAAEKAADDAASKLKKKKEGAKVYIKTP